MDAKANDLSAAKAEYVRTKAVVDFVSQHVESDTGVADWEYAEATVKYINLLEAALTASEARCERLAGAVDLLRAFAANSTYVFDYVWNDDVCEHCRRVEHTEDCLLVQTQAFLDTLKQQEGSAP